MVTEYRYRNGHNGEPIGEPITLSNGAIADPYDLHIPQNGVPYAPKIREWPSPQRVIRYTSRLVLG